MPEKIKWTVSAQVLGGAKIAESRELEVEAYDKLKVIVNDGDTDKKIDIQPGGATQVHFLMISSDLYNDIRDTSLNLCFKINDSSDSISLDAPLLLIGNGAVEMLDPGSSPKSISFTNSLGEGKNATIQILVGRDATP